LEHPRVANMWIRKHALQVRPAWEIGMHDPDSMAIRPDDKVMIPPTVQDAPVLKLIQWRKTKGR
jgi:hypothetical protein